jgi:Tfp pilus assembly protein PilN
MKAVNLLPTELRSVPSARGERPEVKGGMGPFVVLGVLALLVAGVAGVVLSDNAISAKQTELAAATASQQAIQAQVTKLKPYADFDAVAKSRVATVKDLAGRRFDWEQAMRDLSRAIPADVTLSSLSGDLGNGTGSGSGNAIRGAIAAPAIDLQGCTTNQRSVALLMSRLGDVDGVTRVSLAKSTKLKAAATSTGEAPPCGAGSKPTFDIVAFFADAATKTAAPGATATAAAGATSAATPTAAATATATATAPTAGGTTK